MKDVNGWGKNCGMNSRPDRRRFGSGKLTKRENEQLKRVVKIVVEARQLRQKGW